MNRQLKFVLVQGFVRVVCTTRRRTRNAKWNSLKNEGYTKRNVISEPLNETTLDPWDIWSLHFTYGGSDFYELIKVYDNNYPRRNLQIS